MFVVFVGISSLAVGINQFGWLQRGKSLNQDIIHLRKQSQDGLTKQYQYILLYVPLTIFPPQSPYYLAGPSTWIELSVDTALCPIASSIPACHACAMSQLLVIPIPTRTTCALLACDTHAAMLIWSGNNNLLVDLAASNNTTSSSRRRRRRKNNMAALQKSNFQNDV